MRKEPLLSYSDGLDGVMNSRPMRLVQRMVTLRRFTTIFVSFIALSEFGWLPQVVTNGFYCDDRSIQRPYNGDTVTTSMVIVSGVLPLLLIWFTEALFYAPNTIESTKSEATSTRCSESWHHSWYWFKKYARGLIIKLLIVDTLKIFSGEHRPHFLDTCRPDVVCEGNEYISTYICTNTEDRPYFIRDASKSFPSGHSSMSVFEVVFMIWYLQKRVPKLRTCMALPLCQLLVATWGIFCPMSRIMDNRHHWWDVLAGSMIGVVAATLTCVLGCRNFEQISKMVTHSTYKDHDIKLIGNNAHYKDDSSLNNIIHSS